MLRGEKFNKSQNKKKVTRYLKMDSVDILTLTVIAFTGSFGHCLGMCGGIVIAYSSAKIDNRWKKSYEIFVHTLYSLGRVTTYVLLGTLFGTIGGVVKFNGYTTGVLTLIAGIFMILAGLSLIGKLPFLNRIEYSLSQSSWYQTAFRYILKDKSLYSFYLLGILEPGLLSFVGWAYFAIKKGRLNYREEPILMGGF